MGTGQGKKQDTSGLRSSWALLGAVKLSASPGQERQLNKWLKMNLEKATGNLKGSGELGLNARSNRESESVYKQRNGITTSFWVETTPLGTDSSGKKLVAERGGEGQKRGNGSGNGEKVRDVTVILKAESVELGDIRKNSTSKLAW